MPAPMRLQDPTAGAVVDEFDIYTDLLPLDGARIIELGCGAAMHTRAIAGTGLPAAILACEVDVVQHRKNLALTDLDRVTFALAGAEAIPAADAGTDIVMLFKSLHHIPTAAMDAAFDEIARVLRPGGLVYISEPVYAGDFNDILRMFHDEREVREAAFAATLRALDRGILKLVEQRFFNTRIRFEDFAEFEEAVLGATHTRHELSPDLLERVRAAFERHHGPDGACFLTPIRVDLLSRP